MSYPLAVLGMAVSTDVGRRATWLHRDEQPHNKHRHAEMDLPIPIGLAELFVLDEFAELFRRFNRIFHHVSPSDCLIRSILKNDCLPESLAAVGIGHLNRGVYEPVYRALH